MYDFQGKSTETFSDGSNSAVRSVTGMVQGNVVTALEAVVLEVGIKAMTATVTSSGSALLDLWTREDSRARCSASHWQSVKLPLKLIHSFYLFLLIVIIPFV